MNPLILTYFQCSPFLFRWGTHENSISIIFCTVVGTVVDICEYVGIDCFVSQCCSVLLIHRRARHWASAGSLCWGGATEESQVWCWQPGTQSSSTRWSSGDPTPTSPNKTSAFTMVTALLPLTSILI